MQVDYLIIGQGICGTMLSWFLHKEGKSFVIIDEEREQSASKVAAGIMNPVTGRRYIYTWMGDIILPFAEGTYREMGHYLGGEFVFLRTIIDFFPSPQMRQAFIERLTENDSFLHTYPNQNHFNPQFNYEFGCGEIGPAYTVHLGPLLAAWRARLEEKQVILSRPFLADQLQISDDSVSYHEIRAEKIIFCEGIEGSANPWFQLLPFSPSKGEALIIECQDLERHHIFKKGMLLAPLAEPGQFWVGSNYQWEFQDDQPSEQFRQHTTAVLDSWLKCPYKLLAHKAAVRPATVERRPFVGFHPLHPAVGIFNGMGTKGTSLAPFFAHQLVQHLVHNFPLTPEADVKRFSRILSK